MTKKEIKKELERIHDAGRSKEALGIETNMLAIEILSAVNHLIRKLK